MTGATEQCSLGRPTLDVHATQRDSKRALGRQKTVLIGTMSAIMVHSLRQAGLKAHSIAMKARTCGKGPIQGQCTACARVCNDSEGCCFGSSRSQLHVECGGCGDPIHQLSTIEYCGRTEPTQQTTVVATFIRMRATVAERTDECKRQKHKAAKRKGTASTARSS
jgi:hypothetical protein